MNFKMNSKKSIIWNLTRQCTWSCKFCCVDAKFTGNLENVNKTKDKNYRFEDELTFNEKIRVIDQLERNKYRIDFSGGDLLIDPLNIDLILYASEKLGKENVSMSVSGAFIKDELINKLKDKISDVEITLDYIPYEYYSTRPVGYHEYAANAMIKLKESGFKVGAQTVITNENINYRKIYKLYRWIVENKIDGWSLLRFFPSGRGKRYSDLVPSYSSYCDVVSWIKEISKGENVEISFQYLLPNHDKYSLECRAVRKSIGITPNGTVVSCFWALDEHMKPKNEKFILGKLPDQSIDEIMNSKNALEWMKSNKCIFFSKDELESNNSNLMYINNKE